MSTAEKSGGLILSDSSGRLGEVAAETSIEPEGRPVVTERTTHQDLSGRLTQAGEHVADISRQARDGFATLSAADTLWRVFTTSDGGSTVQVAQQVEVRRELTEKAALQVAVPLLVLVPVGCLVVGWAMGQALGDLNRLARQIESLPADSRDPIDLARVPSEAAPLVVAMNRLIERLRESLTQQRKFLSDAAHELRTPMTALDLQINNLARGDATATPGLLADLRQGSRRAATLVDQLLRMARLDAVADASDQQDLDLGTVLLEAMADHVALAESRAVDLGLVASALVPIEGSARDLRIMLGNLIDNAVKYTPAGGAVDVGIARNDRAFSIDVLDTGPGLDPPLLARVFDRFFRAASPDVDGSGLGLAVAQAIAARHGMTITVANRTDRSGLHVAVGGCVRAAPIRAGSQAGNATPAPSTVSQT